MRPISPLRTFVADLRAPTPSAAAELAVPDLSNIQPVLQEFAESMDRTMQDVIVMRRESLRARAQMLWLLNPRRTVDADRQQVDAITERLGRAIHRIYERQTGRLGIAQAELMAFSPEAALARGFAIVRDVDGRVIVNVDQARSGEQILIRVSDGEFTAQVTK